MKSLFSGVASRFQKHRRIVEWARVFVSYSAVQALVQAMGFYAGILVVRGLSTQDYAYFTIVNTIVPIINLLSDTGVSNSLSSIGGKHWQDDARMGSLVKTAMVLRRQLVLLSGAVVTPILILMLWRIHAPPATIWLLVPITLIGVFFQLNTGVLGVVVGLRQQVQRMQRLAFWGVVPRLAVIGLLVIFGLLNAPLAVAAGTVAIAVQFWLLSHWVKPQIAWDAPPDAQFRKDILANVKRQAPMTIYYCVQGQLGIWLISIFGNVDRVAEVGALGRIGMIFSILTATISALVVPRFARCQDPVRLRSVYFQIVFVVAGVLAAGTFFCWWMPGPLLWLLGPKYQQLGSLVWLAVLATGSASFSGVLYGLNVNRSWIPPAAFVIPAEVLAQVVLCLIFDLSSVRGVLLLGVFSPIVYGAVSLCLAIRRLRAMNAPTAQQGSDGKG